MSRFRSRSMLWLLLIFIVAAGASTAYSIRNSIRHAQDGKEQFLKDDPVPVTVRQLDLDKSMITVSLGPVDRGGPEARYKIAPTVEVSMTAGGQSRKAKLKEIHVGDHLMIHFNKDRSAVDRIDMARPAPMPAPGQ